MRRLTVHVENAPFVTKVQKTTTTKVEIPQDSAEEFKKYTTVTTKKPKKAKCIVNTFSVRNLRSDIEIDRALIYLRSKYKIAKNQRGDEMIHISNEY